MTKWIVLTVRRSIPIARMPDDDVDHDDSDTTIICAKPEQ